MVKCLLRNTIAEAPPPLMCRLSEENRLFERALGLAGVWGNLVRQWLNEVLPENAADLCR